MHISNKLPRVNDDDAVYSLEFTQATRAEPVAQASPPAAAAKPAQSSRLLNDEFCVKYIPTCVCDGGIDFGVGKHLELDGIAVSRDRNKFYFVAAKEG